MSTRRASYLPILAFCFCGFITNSSQAVTFGIYDNRTLALGGAGVALGDIKSGFFYNPAHLAFHEGDEDYSKDGRVSFGLVFPQISRAAESAIRAIDEDVEGQLTNAINAYNASPSAQTASLSRDAAIELQDVMNDLSNQDIFADFYSGLHISEPGDFEGGAFFIGTRLVIEGTADIAQEDFDLIEDYIEALDFIVPGGNPGVAHPELFDPNNGQLRDPSDSILSSADARGLILTEIGVAAGKQFEFWGQTVALGFAPKAVQARTIDDQWRIEDGSFEGSDVEEYELFFNFDIGVTVPLGDSFKVSLATKDVLAKTYVTELGNPIKIKPRSRLGLSYSKSIVTAGMDFDLSANDTIRPGLKTQEVSLGVEVQIGETLFLRGGYKSDLEKNYSDTTTAGIGVQFGWFELEGALSQGGGELGGGLQFSVRR